MASIEEIEAKLAKREERRKKQEAELKELRTICKLPFYIRIQQPGFEDQLKRIEAVQTSVMKTAYKRWNVTQEECKDLAGEFMIEYLAGEVKDINEFMNGRGYKRVGTINRISKKD